MCGEGSLPSVGTISQEKNNCMAGKKQFTNPQYFAPGPFDKHQLGNFAQMLKRERGASGGRPLQKTNRAFVIHGCKTDRDKISVGITLFFTKQLSDGKTVSTSYPDEKRAHQLFFPPKEFSSLFYQSWSLLPLQSRPSALFYKNNAFGDFFQKTH